MSHENVEVVRLAIEAFNRRDGDTLRDLFDVDAEITPVRAAVDGTVYRGGDAPASYCAAIEASWEDLRWEVEDIRDGEDWVLALGHIRGRGRQSGVLIDARGGWLAHLGRGRIFRFQTYSDRNDALKAAGLAE